MALYRYFEPVSNLPNPKGPLSLRNTGIKEANEAVRAVANVKIKIVKFYSEVEYCFFVKFWTRENFPLYGIHYINLLKTVIFIFEADIF